MLEIVNEVVLQGLLEDWREMGSPHRAREQDPCHHRVAHGAEDPRVEDRQDEAPPEVRPGNSQKQRHRRSERDQWRGEQGQHHVLDHVRGEEGVVVQRDRRLEGHLDDCQAPQEGDRSCERDRGRRVEPVDPPNRPDPAERGP